MPLSHILHFSNNFFLFLIILFHYLTLSLPLYHILLYTLSLYYLIPFSLSPSISHTSMNETATTPHPEPCSGTIDTTFPSLLCMLGSHTQKWILGDFGRLSTFLVYTVYCTVYSTVMYYCTVHLQ